MVLARCSGLNKLARFDPQNSQNDSIVAIVRVSSFENYAYDYFFKASIASVRGVRTLLSFTCSANFSA